METNSLKTILQTLVDENISTDSIHIWTGVKDRLAARNYPLFQQGVSMKPNLFSRRRAPLALMTALFVLFALAVLVVTPPGRALAQQILQFFNRTESNMLVVPTIEASLAPVKNYAATVPSTNTPAAAYRTESPVEADTPASTDAGCGTPYAPSCRVDQIQSQVVFPIQALTNLPNNVRFVGAAPYQGGVVLTYESKGTLMLIETPEAQDAFSWQVSNDATVEAVTISNLPGEYVQGGWMGATGNGSVTWDATLPTQTLRWAVDGIRYTLSYTPGKISDTPDQFELDTLVAMAAGIRPAEQAGLPTLAVPDLSLQQIKQQIGFEVFEPVWLPTRFALRHATYYSQSRAACLYFDAGPNDVEYPLIIVERNGALPAAKDLRPVVLYDGKVIEVPTPEEKVTVRGADGEQGTLASNGLETSKVCGGESQVMNNALLWQSGTRSYIIFGRFDNYHGEGYVTRMEMIRVAETLNGIGPSDAYGNLGRPDPERLFSVRDAETVTGVDILAPARMLPSLHLDHIAYHHGDTTLSAASWPNMIVTLYTRQSPSNVSGDRILITQVPHAEWTLAQREREGGCTADTVRGLTALYQEFCWQGAGVPGCRQTLIWLEGSTGFEIQTNFASLLPKSLIFDIAESMR